MLSDKELDLICEGVHYPTFTDQGQGQLRVKTSTGGPDLATLCGREHITLKAYYTVRQQWQNSNNIVVGWVRAQLSRPHSFFQKFDIALPFACVTLCVMCVAAHVHLMPCMHMFIHVCVQPEVVHGYMHGACMRVCV